ncbi:MAG: hypothetical protein BWY05_01222 [Euryarchaeota archaeon ADurb.Bin165]|jgi:hypothetical protein|nr:MAG: hypothetical protein BWY05_01222 [Euryarchaeota archaeon ADurb.Bin165]
MINIYVICYIFFLRCMPEKVGVFKCHTLSAGLIKNVVWQFLKVHDFI